MREEAGMVYIGCAPPFRREIGFCRSHEYAPQVLLMRVVEIDNLSEAGDIEGLLAALCDDDEHIREVAADALGAFPDEQVEEVLREVKFNDPVQTVREHAARSHGRVVERLKVEKGTMV